MTTAAAAPAPRPYSSRLAKRLAQSAEFWTSWFRDPALDVAEAVLRLRRFRGLSQEDLAERMTTTQSAVARLERGKANVRLSTLVKLAEALDATVRIDVEPVEMLERWTRHPRWWEREAEGAAPIAALPTPEYHAENVEGSSLLFHLTADVPDCYTAARHTGAGAPPEHAAAGNVQAREFVLARLPMAAQP